MFKKPKFKIRINKVLIKKGFKSIFKTKAFAILMSSIVLISGATYTMLQSSSNSLSKSYDYVVKGGKLSDALIKENFITEPNSALQIYVDTPNKSNIANEVFIEKKWDDLKNNSSNNQYPSELSLNILAKGTGSYKLDSNNLPSKKIVIHKNSSPTIETEISLAMKQVTAFKAQITSFIRNNMANEFTNALENSFNGDIVAKNIQTLSVSVTDGNSTPKAFKMVNLGDNKQQNKQINKLIMYDGTSLFTSPQSDKGLSNQLDKKIQAKWAARNISSPELVINKLKGYKYNAVNNIGEVVTVEDPSSYEAVVSPAFANANGKQSISQSEISEILNENPMFMSDLPNNENLQNKYSNSLMQIDNTWFFIIGIGTTPDFVYPIIDQEHPTIQVNNQAIVFLNNRGYERIYDGFRANPQENYIAIKYKDGLSSARIQEIKSELKRKSTGGYWGGKDNIRVPLNQWPNIEAFTTMSDKNDSILLVQERVRFLDSLHSTINTLSYATTSLLTIFVAAIIIMVFNVLLNINKKTFATMLALGYSKTHIALTNALSSLFLIGIPSVFGYIAGYGLQYWFTGIFSNYWTIPSYATAFSWVSLVFVAVVPIFTIGLLISAVTLWQLRKPIPSMLSESDEIGFTWLTKLVSKMKYIGIQTKYSIGLTLKNIGKLSLLTITSIIAMISVMIGMGTLGKASKAYNETVAVSNYNFEVDLYSPTLEGGQYQRIDVENKDIKMHQYPKATYDGNGVLNSTMSQDKAHWHVPGLGDATYGIASSAGKPNNLLGASKYLKNMLQTKVLLDDDSLGINPWDIAKRLMPENQKNTANKNAIEIIDNIYPKNVHPTLNMKADSINKLIDKDGKTPYIISYNQIITNESDELYTYVDTTTNKGKKLRIIGLQEDTKMVNISSHKLKEMNQSSEVLPILIDKYIAKDQNLSKGNYINLVVNNMVDRNFKSNKKSNIVKAKVFGIVNGYNSTGIYTTQSKANKLIGIDQFKSTPFNGVFSKKKQPAIIKTLPLYSPSGLYIGTDSIYGDWEKNVDQMLKDQNIWSFGSNITNNINEFKQIYSTTPYVASTLNVDWKEINKLTFKNISNLSASIITIIEVISISLSVIFTFIVAGLLLISNRKKIAALWTLGYRKREIGKIFTTIYILPLIISIMFAIPISIWFLFILQSFVMNFGSILIPFALSWWIPFVAIFGIALIFIISTGFTIMNQKQEKALEAFKGD